MKMRRDRKLERYEKQVATRRHSYERAIAKTVERYEKQVATLQQRLDARDAKDTEAIRYHKLEALRERGILFEMAEELEDVRAMDDKQFEAHIVRMEKKYQRAPVNAPRLPTPMLPQERSGEPDKHEKALGDKVKELNDLQNVAYDRARKSGGQPPPHKSYYELKAEAEKIIGPPTKGKTA
jgi:hypothetical protein